MPASCIFNFYYYNYWFFFLPSKNSKITHFGLFCPSCLQSIFSTLFIKPE